jgi:hypothetical protein
MVSGRRLDAAVGCTAFHASLVEDEAGYWTVDVR